MLTAAASTELSWRISSTATELSLTRKAAKLTKYELTAVYYYLNPNSTLKGRWAYGKLQSATVVYEQGGTRDGAYDGAFAGGARAGVGTYTYSNGDVYSGSYRYLPLQV